MSLEKFYSLRTNFIVFGLTGRMQGGVDRFARLLEKEDNSFAKKILTDEFINAYANVSDSESRKVRRLRDFYDHYNNWKQFKVIEYKNVVLLFLLRKFYNIDSEKYAENIVNFIVKIGEYKKFQNPRYASEFGIAKGSKDFITQDFKRFLISNLQSVINLDKISGNFFSNNWSESEKSSPTNTLFFFQREFKNFASGLFDILDSHSIYLRHKLIHVLSYYLRNIGDLDFEKIKLLGLDTAEYKNTNLDNIYTIAELIKKIIKDFKNSPASSDTHIIIDRLKNSLEILYFRERYSGFYLVASNRNDNERIEEIREKVKKKNPFMGVDSDVQKLLELDEVEYKIDEFKQGKFDSFDIENCVQKADYHLVLNKDTSANLIKEYLEVKEQIKQGRIHRTNKYYVFLPFEIQCLKLLALIQQPGLITPTYIERTMQIAYNAKLNSGCISRQVGAVVTDSSFSVKGIGWNDVPNGQTPCSLRDLRDYATSANKNELRKLQEFTNFEKGDTEHVYKDKETFSNKLLRDASSLPSNSLQGRPCAYCFKTFHNAYEGESNQVHTRSLHAEENAMLQISKNGGQGLYGGNLFTTASPCELCAKKAFQLGLKNIFYIDLYPGISKNHILEGGSSPKINPVLYQFQGAIGRGFHKLYEPFMSVKDETIIRSGISPTKKEMDDKQLIENLKKKARQYYNCKEEEISKLQTLDEIIKYLSDCQ
ncbi:hypothetical protein [Elizabethkingia meningoseptica]|uniref:hypothetical protein n=1 Tax=Elizabethkingia meningoseptica TaxID=238 RepID=UPI0023B12DF5|nr:hypothetical protein [Elizabethkingia meningoseptica]